jgi:S1-C subfamily serine protease
MRNARARTPWIAVVPLILALTPAAPARAEDTQAWLGVKLGGSEGEARGVLLGRIFVDSPADRAGLRAGDIVLTIDGEPTSSRSSLIGQIQHHEPGSWVALTVERQGETMTLDVRLAARPAVVRESRVRTGWIGVEAIDLPPALRAHFGAPEDAGVMVSSVVEGSPAEAAGFELGDVVWEIDGQSVHGLGQLQEKIAGSGVGNEAEVRLARDGVEIDLEVQIADAPPEARP